MEAFFQVFIVLVLAIVSVRVETSRNSTEAELSASKDGESVVYDDSNSDPSLDKLRLPSIIINRKDFTMKISEQTVEGFQNMSMKKESPLMRNKSMGIEVFVPEVTIRADYYHLIYRPTWLWFGFPNLDNVGEFKCDIKNLKVNGTVRLGLDDFKNTVITSLSIVYSYERVQIDLSGSSIFVNKVVNRRVLDILTDTEVTKLLVRVVKDQTKPFLQEYTPQDNIEMDSPA